MAKLSKRAKAIKAGVQPGKIYSIEEAFAVLKTLSTVKFVESVDVAVNLGVDPRKSDQAVRGATVMPHGTGKTVRVAVFTQGANADAARAAGADIVGMDDLAAQVKAGEINFDVVIASPDAMRVVGQLGQILGPRGLMPNPKVGTVTPMSLAQLRTPRPVRFVTAPTRKASFTPLSARLASSRMHSKKTWKPCWPISRRSSLPRPKASISRKSPCPPPWARDCRSIRVAWRRKF